MGIRAFVTVLGAVAILNLLVAAVAERRRELALLRIAGATGTQLSCVVLFDGLLVGASGASPASPRAWARQARPVPPTQFMGWTVEPVVDLRAAAVAEAMTLAPALSTRRIRSAELLIWE